MNLTSKSTSMETPPKMALKKQLPLSIAAVLLALGTGSAGADIVHADDVIIDGSLCVGFDCVNGESFGFDTIRIKENNLRIKAQDTSNSASFPTRDWQITFNDSTNGGAEKFSIDDIDGGRTPFTIRAGAPSNSLYVDASGRVGLGTSTPVVELHVANGDSPTLRLEQNGSSGFTPQTWDVAGNETNFFVRDATNGSKLPFKIRPGAPTNSLYVNTNGDVGFGTASPDADVHVLGEVLIDQADTGPGSAPLHLRRSDGTAQIIVEETATTEAERNMLTLSNNGASKITFANTSTNVDRETYELENTSSGEFVINQIGTGIEFRIEKDGDLRIRGSLLANNGADPFPDYVFKSDYDLLTIDELSAFISENGHLPKVPSASDIERQGSVNMTSLQLTLLEKVEELTLYTIQQHETIRELQSKLSQLEPPIE